MRAKRRPAVLMARGPSPLRSAGAAKKKNNRNRSGPACATQQPQRKCAAVGILRRHRTCRRTIEPRGPQAARRPPAVTPLAPPHRRKPGPSRLRTPPTHNCKNAQKKQRLKPRRRAKAPAFTALANQPIPAQHAHPKSPSGGVKPQRGPSRPATPLTHKPSKPRGRRAKHRRHAACDPNSQCKPHAGIQCRHAACQRTSRTRLGPQHQTQRKAAPATLRNHCEAASHQHGWAALRSHARPAAAWP